MFWSVYERRCSESVYIVYYAVFNNGLPLDVQFVNIIDQQQLMAALSGSNTSQLYSGYLFTGSVDELVPFRALLRLPFARHAARPSYAITESIVQRFYQTRYPGPCVYCLLSLWCLDIGYGALWRIQGGGDGAIASPFGLTEFLDNFCTVFASFVILRLNCKIHVPRLPCFLPVKTAAKCTQTYHFGDKNDFFLGRYPAPFTTYHSR